MKNVLKSTAEQKIILTENFGSIMDYYYYAKKVPCAVFSHSKHFCGAELNNLSDSFNSGGFERRSCGFNMFKTSHSYLS